jgi:hypothetical protein
LRTCKQTWCWHGVIENKEEEEAAMAGNTKRGGSSKRGRSAVTGRFVKQATVKRRPKTTVNESTKRRAK